MIISDIVNVNKFKYVRRMDTQVPTRYGNVRLERGFLSDGASVVIDLCEEAFFTHDRLYLKPETDQRRLNKFQCDWVYSVLLLKDIRPVFFVTRMIGLTIGGWSAWNGHREREAKNPYTYDLEYFVPDCHQWVFPTPFIKDAVRLAL